MIFFPFFLLRNNASSNVTRTSSRALNQCCTLDIESRKTKRNVAKMLEDGRVTIFL